MRARGAGEQIAHRDRRASCFGVETGIAPALHKISVRNGHDGILASWGPWRKLEEGTFPPEEGRRQNRAREWAV